MAGVRISGSTPILAIEALAKLTFFTPEECDVYSTDVTRTRSVGVPYAMLELESCVFRVSREERMTMLAVNMALLRSAR